MTAMEVTAKRKKTGATVKASYDFGANLAESTKLFGESVVYNHLIGALKVAFQGGLRAQMDANKSQEEITAWAKSWKPGQRKMAMSPAEKLRKQLNDMTPEDRANILREYKASQGVKEKAA